MLPTDQLCTTVPLITDEQETTPIFHAGVLEFNIGRVWPRKWIREKTWYVIWAHAGFLHLEFCVESKCTQDQIDDTLWHDFIYQVRFCPPYSCTIRYFSMSTNCSTWCRSLLLSFSTCYLGILGLEEAIHCILAWTSHQRATSEKRTKALLSKCPLFRGSSVSASGRSSVIRWMVLLVQVTFSKHLYACTHTCTTEAATRCYTNYTMRSMRQTATYTDSWKQRLIVWGSNHIASKMLLAPYYIGGLTSQFHLIGSLITTKQKRTYRRGNFLCPTKGNGATSNNWTPQKLCFPSLQHLC